MSSLGFVVLARRPNPEHRYTAANCKKAAGYPISTGDVCKACAGDGYVYEPVSAVFPEYPNGLEQAQNVLESRNTRLEPGCDGRCARYECICDGSNPVEYCIGEISERTL